jgi:L-methionine (R)-S-oxide reductase
VPLLTDDSQLIGVLDVDSPELDRFDAEDEAGLSALSSIIARKI